MSQIDLIPYELIEHYEKKLGRKLSIMDKYKLLFTLDILKIIWEDYPDLWKKLLDNED